MRHQFLLFLLPLALLSCTSKVEDTQPGQPVKHRQEAFKAMLRTFEPMGTMLRDNRYEPEQFLRLATTLNTQQDTPWSHFTPGSNYPPSKSRNEIWERASEFEQAKHDFKEASTHLLLAAQEKTQAKVAPAYNRVHEACQACHRTFRNK